VPASIVVGSGGWDYSKDMELLVKGSATAEAAVCPRRVEGAVDDRVAAAPLVVVVRAAAVVAEPGTLPAVVALGRVEEDQVVLVLRV